MLVPGALRFLGHLIGMGGDYGRTIAHIRHASGSRSPILMGLGFECQKCGSISA